MIMLRSCSRPYTLRTRAKFPTPDESVIKQLFVHQEECVHRHLLNEWQNCTLHGLSVDLKVHWVRINLIDRCSDRSEKNLEQAYLCLLPEEH